MSTETKSRVTYECVKCGNRVRTDGPPRPCDRCGGDMRDIGHARE